MKILDDLLNKSRGREEENKLPFGSNECGRFLKDTYKDTTNEVVLINEGYYKLLENYDILVADISQWEIEKKIIEHTLQNEIKNHETAFCRERRITWKSVVKNSIDTKALKRDLPEIAEKYTKTSTSRVFKISRG